MKKQFSSMAELKAFALRRGAEVRQGQQRFNSNRQKTEQKQQISKKDSSR